MSKYIIKNCPCLIDFDEQSLFENLCKNGGSCKDCTDCVLKQIVAECNEQENLMDGMDEQDMDFQYYYGRYVFAREILHLLDIQEVE